MADGLETSVTNFRTRQFGRASCQGQFDCGRVEEKLPAGPKVGKPAGSALLAEPGGRHAHAPREGLKGEKRVALKHARQIEPPTRP